MVLQFDAVKSLLDEQVRRMRAMSFVVSDQTDTVEVTLNGQPRLIDLSIDSGILGLGAREVTGDRERRPLQHRIEPNQPANPDRHDDLAAHRLSRQRHRGTVHLRLRLAAEPGILQYQHDPVIGLLQLRSGWRVRLPQRRGRRRIGPGRQVGTLESGWANLGNFMSGVYNTSILNLATQAFVSGFANFRHPAVRSAQQRHGAVASHPRPAGAGANCPDQRKCRVRSWSTCAEIGAADRYPLAHPGQEDSGEPWRECRDDR
jgi:hypothetical protein